MKTHKGKNILGISFGFIDNAAVLTAEEGVALGDFHKLSLPFHTIYVCTSPKGIQQAFVTNDEKYQKSKIYWKQLKAVTGDSIGTLEGKEWLELRSFENPFYKPGAVRQYLQEVDSIIDQHISKWKKSVPYQHEYAISGLLSQLNIEIILKTVFGINREENLEELVKAIEDGENIIAWRSKYPWRPYTGWISGQNFSTRKDLKVFDDLVRKSIATTKPELMAKQLYNSMPATFTEAEKLKRLRNELIVHLGAGTETAAVSLSWTLYLLSLHPEVLTKAEEEVNGFDPGPDIFDYSHQLPYLKQLTEESLRLYPPSHAIVRDCVEEHLVDGHKVGKGTTVYASVYGIHRNPRLWAEPEKFDPERFSEENRQKIPDYAYIPFGLGKHTCIGRYLAMPLLLMSLFKILKNFSLQKGNVGGVKPVSLSTLKPDKKIKIILRERLQYQKIRKNILFKRKFSYCLETGPEIRSTAYCSARK